MGGELVKLSETRWRFATSKRVFYIRQLKAPNEDSRQAGVFQVDGGGGSVCLMAADSVDQLVEAAGKAQSLAPKATAV